MLSLLFLCCVCACLTPVLLLPCKLQLRELEAKYALEKQTLEDEVAALKQAASGLQAEIKQLRKKGFETEACQQLRAHIDAGAKQLEELQKAFNKVGAVFVVANLVLSLGLLPRVPAVSLAQPGPPAHESCSRLTMCFLNSQPAPCPYLMCMHASCNSGPSLFPMLAQLALQCLQIAAERAARIPKSDISAAVSPYVTTVR